MIVWQPSKLTIQQKEERRLAAARLLQQGWSQAAVARQMQVNHKTVNRWRTNCKKAACRHWVLGLNRDASRTWMLSSGSKC